MATVKLWDTVSAAAQLGSPAWSASMVQVPMVRRVMVLPFVPVEVHTPVVVELKVTSSPDEAVADTSKGGSSRRRPARVSKVMVWAVLIVKLCDARGATP